MRGHTLLYRIRHPELAAARRVVSDEEVRAAVMEHLRAMFLTRAGSSVGAPDYGIISVTDIVHLCPDATEDVLKSIRNTIRKYEPRLTNVSVKHVPAAMTADATMRFDIAGEIENEGRRTTVKFQTVIDAARNVRVE